MLTLGVIHVLDLYDPEDKDYKREQIIAENIYDLDLDVVLLQDCTSLQLSCIQEKIGHLAYRSKVQMQCKNPSFDAITMCARKVSNVRQLKNINGIRSTVLIVTIEIPPDKSTPRSLEIEIANLYIPENVNDESRKLVIEFISATLDKQAIICGDFLGYTNNLEVLRDWNRVFHFGHVLTRDCIKYNPVAIYHTSGIIVNNATLVDVATPYCTEKLAIRCCVSKRRPSSLLLDNKRLRQRSCIVKSEPDVSPTRSFLSLDVDTYVSLSDYDRELPSTPHKHISFDKAKIGKKVSVVEVGYPEKPVLEDAPVKSTYIKKLMLPKTKPENIEPLTPRGHKPNRVGFKEDCDKKKSKKRNMVT